MKRVTTALITVLVGCATAEGPIVDLEPFDEELGNHVAIHVGGVCSTDYLVGKGGGTLGVWDDVISVNAVVNQRETMSRATDDLRDVLDENCTGNDWCTVFTFSNGGAMISRVLSIYGERWNLLAVLATGSNEGGSELSRWGRVGEVFTSCAMLDQVSPTQHRSGWNHNDTAGVTFYMLAGNKCMAPWLQCALLPGEDDGAVAFHSAGGMNDTYRVTELCDSPLYDNHEIAYTCDGRRKTHYQLKNEGVCLAGGC